MPARLRFSLQGSFVVLAGTMTGGQTARSLLLAETPSLGGVRVSWSAWGEAIFFCIGCSAALAGMAMAASAPALLRVRSPCRGRNNFRRMVALMVGATLLGAVSAGTAFVAVGLIFNTVPQEIFDFLTTKR
ncbi:MAG: hypothetical protein ACREHD_30655 [Pirellulales bacterium]